MAYADFQDFPFRPGDDALTDLTDGRGITERLYDPGVDVIAVQRHPVILSHADADEPPRPERGGTMA